MRAPVDVSCASAWSITDVSREVKDTRGGFAGVVENGTSLHTDSWRGCIWHARKRAETSGVRTSGRTGGVGAQERTHLTYACANRHVSLAAVPVALAVFGTGRSRQCHRDSESDRDRRRHYYYWLAARWHRDCKPVAVSLALTVRARGVIFREVSCKILPNRPFRPRVGGGGQMSCRRLMCAPSWRPLTSAGARTQPTRGLRLQCVATCTPFPRREGG